MDDRREFPRVNAPVYCRPVGKPLFGKRKAQDISMGGLRLYSDDLVAPGERLELELFLGDKGGVVCTVEVVWADELGPDAAARYDIGVKFVQIAAQDREKLSGILVAE